MITDLTCLREQPRHHINSKRTFENINDKQNLIWLCENCHKREHKN
ncbi:HNH endonuclease [Enterococcus termitis]